MKDWVNVFKTGNIIDAELIKSVLLGHGIEAIIVNKIDSSYLFFGEATVFCPPEEAEEAKNIIKLTQEPHE